MGEAMKLDEAFRRRLESEPVIYQDPIRILRVQPSLLKFAAGEMFEAMLDSVAEPGLPWSRPFRIGGAEKILVFRTRMVTAGYVHWNLFFGEPVLNEVRKIVAEVPTGQSYLDGYRLVDPPPGSKARYAREADPVAKRLLAYLLGLAAER